MTTPPVTSRTPNMTISPVTPAGATAGDLWWSTITGREYIFYDDGDTLQWVATQPFQSTGSIASGTITGVFAGYGLTGGGEIGNVTLNIDPTVVQVSQFQGKIITADYPALAFDKIFADTRGNPITISLPASPADQVQVLVEDLFDSWSTNWVSFVTTDGSLIDEANLVIAESAAGLGFIYLDGTWRVRFAGPLFAVQPGVSLAFFINPAPEPGDGVSDNEFNGPFIDWVYAHRDYGADNTGNVTASPGIQDMVNAIADDTAVIGNPAIDPHYRCYNSQTGYLEPGHYLIDQTILVVDSSHNVTDSFEGRALRAQPGTVTFEWIGADGGDMLWMNGCNGSTVQGIKFILNNARAGIRFERDPNLTLTSQTGNQIVDCEFHGDLTLAPTGGQYGVFGTQDTGPGANQGTDSETSVTRCRFFSLNNRGVCVTGVQGFNWYIRQSYFEQCSVAISDGNSGTSDTYPFNHSNLLINTIGHFHAFDNIFNGSGFVDVQRWGGGAPSAISRNVSINSNRFLQARIAYLEAADNRVVNAIQTDCVQLVTLDRGDNLVPGGGLAPTGRSRAVFLRNKIKSRPGATGPIISEIYDAALDDDKFANDAVFRDYYIRTLPIWFAQGNQFSVSYSDVIGTSVIRTNNTILDTLLDQTIDDTLPLKVPYAQVVARETFVLGYDHGESPQTVVNAASDWATAHLGSRPVAYFPNFSINGAWNELSVPLEFPPDLKMSFQGCGRGSVFGWTGDPGDDTVPMIWLQGPSKVTVRDMLGGRQSGGGGKAGRIFLVDNCDQVGARALSEKGVFRFFINECAHLTADIVDHKIGSDSVTTIAGHASDTGFGRVLCEGVTIDNDSADACVSLTGSGKLFLRATWFESGVYPQINYAVSGSGPEPGWFSFEVGRSFNGAPDFGRTDEDFSDPGKTLTVSEIGGDGYEAGTTVHVAVSDGSIGSWIGKVVDGASGGDTAQVRITSIVDGFNALGVTLDLGWAVALRDTPLVNWTLRTFDTNWRYVQMTSADFNGQISLLGSAMLGEITVSGDASATDYFNLGGSQMVEEGSSATNTFYRNHGPQGPQESIQYGDYTPMGVSGALPMAYATLLQTLVNTRPVVFIVDNPDGVTDVRFYRVTADTEFMAGTYS